MNKRQKARLALEILNESGAEHPYQELTEFQADVVAPELIEHVYSALIGKGAQTIEELIRLGYSNRIIAQKVGYDESTLTRIRKKSDDLQIALSTLRDLIDALATFLAGAKHTRLRQSVNTSSIVPIGFCSLDKTVSDEDRRSAARAVFSNLSRSLSGNDGQRIPLPPSIFGVLLRIGSWENGLRVYQSEGRDNAEILQHEIHEVEKLLAHMKDDLARMTARALTQKPKSAF